ncbi:Mss4-like protein [Daldinia vernicosa]|uniref:Mss4-like protein n=1 Tax=Daldinia vernicosa TaxID=114800 RepID=UPI0020079427|nr:Mss4-like protein [Daldinia vernicosa]KAI0850094.1 Mss4-like protein [Daldinia vernicosa]
MSGLSFQPAVPGSMVQIMGIQWPPPVMPGIGPFEREISLEIECLCGKISATIHGHVPLQRICHCRECKKITGGTHGDFLLIRNNSMLTWRCNTAELKAFSYYVGEEETENNVKNVFRCPTCFTPIFIGQGNPNSNIMLFFVGCLADPTWLDDHKPDSETFTGDRCAWLPRIAPPSAPCPGPQPKLE